MTTEIKMQASAVREGDFLPGLDHGYVVEVETGNGYLSYPASGYGNATAMPEDTLIITFHDANGNENYLLADPDLVLTVARTEA